MTRYDKWDMDDGCFMEEAQDGEYVGYEDVAHLERRHKEAVELLRRAMRPADGMSKQWYADASAFLAEEAEHERT